tara:strand:- start:60 stop:503 length:444 start_codon:yes stop_codon:yes gene_type:complete
MRLLKTLTLFLTLPLLALSIAACDDSEVAETQSAVETATQEDVQDAIETTESNTGTDIVGDETPEPAPATDDRQWVLDYTMAQPGAESTYGAFSTSVFECIMDSTAEILNVDYATWRYEIENEIPRPLTAEMGAELAQANGACVAAG